MITTVKSEKQKRIIKTIKIDVDKCNACHDDMGVLPVHDGSGRFGDGMQVCKACHTTTFPGSHLEGAGAGLDGPDLQQIQLEKGASPPPFLFLGP